LRSLDPEHFRKRRRISETIRVRDDSELQMDGGHSLWD